MTTKIPRTSIVIRTKNEERWLPRCLTMVYAQSYTDFEVVVVDNFSEDSTLEIVREWRIDKVVSIKNYTPGAALNLGIKSAVGKYLVFLSAHCVPCDENWLKNLISPLESNPEIFGTYGRQLPLPLTNLENTRDLLSIFRSESKLQSVDNFFHNANSAITRDSWEKIPFSDDVLNLEDQEWAKLNLLSGTKKIFYNSEAKVYHHDGLHFSQSEDRTKGVVSSLKNMSELEFESYPKFHILRLTRWVSICLFDQEKNLQITENCLTNYAQFITTFFLETNKAKSILVSSKSFYESLKMMIDSDTFNSIYFFERDLNDLDLSRSNDILKLLATLADNCRQYLNFHPEAVFYYNPEYEPTSKENLTNIIANYFLGDLDIVLLGSKISGLAWVKNSSGDFRAIDNVLIPGTKREDVIESYLGAGSVFSTSALIRTKILESNFVRIIDTGYPLKRLKVKDDR